MGDVWLANVGESSSKVTLFPLFLLQALFNFSRVRFIHRTLSINVETGCRDNKRNGFVECFAIYMALSVHLVNSCKSWASCGYSDTPTLRVSSLFSQAGLATAQTIHRSCLEYHRDLLVGNIVEHQHKLVSGKACDGIVARGFFDLGFEYCCLDG